MALVAEIADQIEWVEGDILDIFALEEAMQGVQQVYHCAAVVSYWPKDAELIQEVNVQGTSNVINAALEMNIEKLVHVSSIAALGRTPKTISLDEKAEWVSNDLNSRYGVSKYQAEMEVWRGIAEGLNAAIVNPATILGSGFWEAGTANFFKKVWNGLRFFPLGTTGFVDVRDVARFTVQLMESDISAERFIVSADNWKYERLFATIAEMLDKKPPNIKANAFLSGLKWRWEWIKSKITGVRPIITRETANKSARSIFYQNEKSVAVFNFQYLPLEKTIAETARQFKEAAEQRFEPKYLKF